MKEGQAPRAGGPDDKLHLPAAPAIPGLTSGGLTVETDGFHAFCAARGIAVPCNGCDSVEHDGLDDDGYCKECLRGRASAS